MAPHPDDFVTKAPSENLSSMLSALVQAEAYEDALKVLSAHKPRLPLRDSFEGQHLLEWKTLFDHLALTWDSLDGRHRLIFGSLVYRGLAIEHMYFLSREADFQADINSFRDVSRFAREQMKAYQHLADHPFVVGLRDQLVYIDRPAALNALRGVWSAGDKGGFLFLFDTLSDLQDRAQRRTEGKLIGDRLADDVASYEGLELVVMTVPRGNEAEVRANATPLPPLRVLVSNKAMPVDYAPAGSTEEPSIWTKESPDFWLLSAKGTYTSLRSFVSNALSRGGSSIAHGSYRFVSNDDRCYSTAANALACLQAFISKPSNFAVNAQARVKDQLANIKHAAVGPIYAHRYLRAQGMSPWAEALGFALGHGSRDATANPYAVTQELVRHGFGVALDNVMVTAFHSDDDSSLAKDGMVDGMLELLRDMQQLADDGLENPEALARYEIYRGFHPDVQLFPAEERARLAFEDLSNIAVSHLTGLTVSMSVLEEDDENVRELAKRIPLLEFAAVMLKAGDVTNFMRLHEAPALGRDKGIVRSLEHILKQEGFYLSPRLVAKELGGVELRVLINQAGDLMVRSERMLRYRTVSQIIGAKSLSDAQLALEVLSAIQTPGNVEERKAEQVADLKDFIGRRSFLVELNRQVAALPEERRAPFLTGLYWKIDELSELIAARGVREPTAAVREAIVEAGGEEKPKPRFKRVVDALSHVSALLVPKR